MKAAFHMAMDYVAASRQLVEAVGGADNISSASHCMTRLRLVLLDNSKAHDEKVLKIKGVKSVIRQGGQYQVVIGNEVSNLFKGFKKLGNWGEDSGAPAKTEGNPMQRLFGFISGCMTPMLPAMLGCGMMKVVLTLLTTFAGMSTESSTYTLLFAFADSFFTFLPIFMGVTIAKKMGGNPMLYMIVGASLCYPGLISLMGGAELGTFLGMPCTYLFGLPVICATYTSSVLPMLLMAPVMKWSEDFAELVSPNVLKSFLKPLLFIIICIPCSLYVLGPLGNVVGNLLAKLYSRFSFLKTLKQLPQRKACRIPLRLCWRIPQSFPPSWAKPSPFPPYRTRCFLPGRSGRALQSPPRSAKSTPPATARFPPFLKPATRSGSSRTPARNSSSMSAWIRLS